MQTVESNYRGRCISEGEGWEGELIIGSNNFCKALEPRPPDPESIQTVHSSTGSRQFGLMYFSIYLFLQDVDALGTLTVQSTVVNVKTHVPYYNLKVRYRGCFCILSRTVCRIRIPSRIAFMFYVKLNEKTSGVIFTYVVVHRTLI